MVGAMMMAPAIIEVKPVNVNVKGPYQVTDDNLARMREGKPPTGIDGKPVELHHQGQDPAGPLQELTQTAHRGYGNYSKNHPLGNRQPSRIDRGEAARQREEYWKRRAAAFGEWEQEK
jgi:hypothetical protein